MNLQDEYNTTIEELITEFKSNLTQLDDDGLTKAWNAAATMASNAAYDEEIQGILAEACCDAAYDISLTEAKKIKAATGIDHLTAQIDWVVKEFRTNLYNELNYPLNLNVSSKTMK
ncbi:MAG: hypothetical protein WC627_00305 [Legionella sp.]|jgi:hypothetical protein